MAYRISPNYETKKAFRDAVTRNEVITVFQVEQGPTPDGKLEVEGPWHAAAGEKWHAVVTVSNGKIIQVHR